MNKVIEIGRLSTEVELRATKDGKPVCNFGLAVDRNRKDAGADFFSIIAWDKLATLCKQYCSKGDLVAVYGHLQARPYEKDGQHRTSTEVVAEEVKFLSTKHRTTESAQKDDETEALPY